MAACTFNRLDSRNISTSDPKFPSRLIVDGTDIMVLWNDPDDSGTSDQVRFARFNTTTLLPHSEVVVYTSTVPQESVDMVELDDGTLVASWFSLKKVDGTNVNTTLGSESADGGATWTSPPTEMAYAAGGTSGVNKSPFALMTDGVTVWQLVVNLSAGGSPTGACDLVAYKRTAANTWSTGIRVYDSGGIGGTPPMFQNESPLQAFVASAMDSATHGFAVGWRAEDGQNDCNVLCAIFTTDGWATDATANVVDIVTMSVANAGTALNMVKIGDRHYIQYHDVDDDNRIKLIYTDDSGATWTELGVITAYDQRMDTLGMTGNPTFDSFLCLDQLENLLIGQSSRNVLVNGYHIVFRSVVDPTEVGDWVQAGECTYVTATDTWQTQTCGRAAVVGANLYRLCGMTRGSGPPHYTLEFLAVPDAGWTPDPEDPEITPPPASGAADNNTYLRNNVAEPGGFSAHFFPVAYFMDWDEGDEETGREVQIVLAASPSMDPAVQDADLIPAFTRIDDPGSWTNRVYFDNGDDTVAIRHDPSQFRVISPRYTITQEFNRNVARGALIAWTLTGDGEPTVQVWVDNKLNQTIRLYNTFGEKVERFFPLPTFNNVGSEIQFVVEDLSEFFFAIEMVGVKFIPKLIRGESRG